MNLTTCLRPILSMGLGIVVVVGVANTLEIEFIGQAFGLTGINRTINFQGKLQDSDNLNVMDDDYTVVFTIYNHPTAGTALWTETQTVTTIDGVFRVALGSQSEIPSNMNFNWDGLYLGMKVGTDDEMTPRIRLTAVPYAFNSERVAGLTVTNESGVASTSGTLRIPDGKVVSFGGAFATSGTAGLTLTVSNTTNATLPEGTITLVDTSASQTLTNKLIGSTGLTFSGASTDITTGTDEDLTLVGNGTGIISLNDTVQISTLTNSKGLVYLDDASGTLTSLANGTTGDCLKANTSAAPSWEDCGGSSQWTTTGDDIYYDTGNVGIGLTTGISGKLHVMSSTATDLMRIGYDASNYFSAQVSSAGAVTFNAVGGSAGFIFSDPMILGVAGSSNGSLTFQSAGSSIGSASISMDNSGNLTIQTTQSGASVKLGDGSGDIRFTPGTDDIVMNLDSTGDLLIQDDGTTFAIFNDSGNVGLGTAAPQARLDVIGNANVSGTATSSALAVGYNGIGAGTGNAIFSGNVGIGTTSPGAKLDVLSDSITPLMRIGYDASNYFSAAISSAGAVTFDAIGASAGFAFSDPMTLGVAGSSNGSLTFQSSGAGIDPATITMDNSGNLTLQATQADASVIIGYGAGDITLEPGNDDLIANLAGTGDFLIQDDGTTFAIFNDSGNVGLGTAAPQARLDVIGNANVSGTATSSALAVGYNGIGAGTGNAIFSGNVGIGTSTTGSFKLNVNGATNLGGDVTTTGTTLTASSLSTLTTSTSVSWGGATGLTFTADNALISGSDAASGDLSLQGTTSSTRTTSYVLLQPNGGNVGIGTTAPSELLDVAGNIELTGVVKGSDIGAKVYRTTSLAISPSTFTAIPFTHEEYDTDTMHSTSSNTSRITINTAGKYVLTAVVYHNNASANDQLRFRLNGSNYIGTANESGSVVMNAALVTEFSVNDYVELMIYKGSSGSVLYDGDYSPYFSVQRIAGADLAEYYPVSDKSIGEGDIVSIDPDVPGAVKKADTPYGKTLGVISSNPAVVMGNTPDKEGNKPVGLKGKVPVKVTTRNGVIKNGDEIAASTLPGYGMRAGQAGNIAAIALDNFNPENMKCEAVESIDNIQWPKEGENLVVTGHGLCYALPSGEYVGQILAYIDNSYHEPVILTNTGDLNITKEIGGTYTVISQSDELIQRIGIFKEAVIGKVTAGLVLTKDLEVTGLITINGLSLQDYILRTVTGEEITFSSESAGLTLDARIKNQESRITDLENLIATSTATIQKTDQADKQLTLDTPAVTASNSADRTFEKFDTFLSLLVKTDNELDEVLGSNYVDTFAARQATISANFRVQGDGLFEGILSVIESITTNNLYVSGLAHFFGEVVFKGNVSFDTPPTFTQDTAGYVVVKKGQKTGDVVFAKEYDEIPVINASIISEKITDEQFDLLVKSSVCKKDDREACQDLIDERFFETAIPFVITKTSQRGFTIRLREKAAQNYTFSWSAIAVRKKEMMTNDAELDRKAQTFMRNILSKE